MAHLPGPGQPGAAHTPEEHRAFLATMVADLRATAGRYPADRGLKELIGELHTNSARFAELWEAGVVGRHEAERKTVEHPEVGPLTLDCDVLSVAGADLRIMVYTAEPGTEDAERLALLTVSASARPLPPPASSRPTGW